MLSRRTVLLGGSLLIAAAAGKSLRPTIKAAAKPPPLDDLVPKAIGPWRMIPDPRIQVSLSAGGDPSRDQPYDDQILRTYTDGSGHEIMLAVAYGAQQRQEIKIHRPELCYPAQGWKVLDQRPAKFDVGRRSGLPISGQRLVVTDGTQVEAVSYWIRIGGTYSASPWRTRWVIIQEGMNGRMTDGVLVRISERFPNGSITNESYDRQSVFALNLVKHLSETGRQLLAR